MRAVRYSQVGPADSVLSIVEMDRPEPGPGEVRVRVAWSGVNPSDTKSRAGSRSAQMPFPHVIPHSDGAGIVDAVGDGVASPAIGARVWIWNAAWGRACGTASEWIVLPARQAIELPDETPLEVGACLGIPALTACHAVLTLGGVEARRVLVAGGAGAVGHYAVQMARLCGASQVLASISSDAKAGIAREAGASDVIDYRREPLSSRVLELTRGEGVDRIIEVDMAANAHDDFSMIAPNGEIIVYGSGQPEITLPFVPAILKNIRLGFFIVYHLTAVDRAAAISTLDSWLRSGALTHRIAARMPLERVVDAHRMVETGEATGNVILSPWDDATRPQ